MNHCKHFTYGDRWTDTTTQIARALEARDAARRELNEYHRQLRITNLLFGWTLIAFVLLCAATPFVCWWVLS
jgi:hypothetical protein